MKKFPIVDFDFKAEDQTQNQSHMISSFLSLREQGMTWRAIEELYKKSKYAEYLGWQRIYKASSAAEKVAVPPPIKPEKKAVEVKIEDIFTIPEGKYDLLKQLILNDLNSKESVILSEISNKLNK